jgi:hypothetical protein
VNLITSGEKMNREEMFLTRCKNIAREFFDSDPIRRVKVVRKYSPGRDFHFDIYFQDHFENPRDEFCPFSPQLCIFSKELRQKYGYGLIYHNCIRDISSYKGHNEWNLSGLASEKIINEIIDCVKNYVLPIFGIFNNKEKAIEYLKTDGTKFNDFSEKYLDPLPFLLMCSNKENAEQFLNNFINECSEKDLVIRTYENFYENEYLITELPYFEFIKLAYENGLKIIRE